LLTVLSGAVAIGISYAIQEIIPFLIWMWVAATLACIYAVIAINERRDWSSRILRRIPRLFLVRAFVFPFFSGAAGGILFSLLLMGLVLLTGFGFQYWIYEIRPLRA